MPISGNRDDHEHRDHGRRDREQRDREHCDFEHRDFEHRDFEHRAQEETQVYGITTAETSHTQQITRRQKQYILTMLVRVVSIVVVVSVPGFSWPLKVGLCLVAAIIPYVAVVRANGGSAPEKDPTNLLVGPPPRDELGAAQRGLPKPGEQPGFIRGDFFVKDDGMNGAGPASGPRAEPWSGADGAPRASTANGYKRRVTLPGAEPGAARPDVTPPEEAAADAGATAAVNQDPDRPSRAR